MDKRSQTAQLNSVGSHCFLNATRKQVQLTRKRAASWQKFWRMSDASRWTHCPLIFLFGSRSAPFLNSLLLPISYFSAEIYPRYRSLNARTSHKWNTCASIMQLSAPGWMSDFFKNIFCLFAGYLTKKINELYRLAHQEGLLPSQWSFPCLWLIPCQSHIPALSPLWESEVL